MPSPRAARIRANDPVGLRGRILDAAAQLFQSQGYRGTSMHDLMAAVAITSGGLYHHFPSKMAIGLAVIRERVTEAVDEVWLSPLAQAGSTSAGIDAVFRAVEADLDGAATIRGCMVSNMALELSLVDPAFRREIDAIFETWRDAVAEKLQADQAAGAAQGLDPKTFSTLAVAAYSGAMAMAKASQSTAPLEACRRQLIRNLAA